MSETREPKWLKVEHPDYNGEGARMELIAHWIRTVGEPTIADYEAWSDFDLNLLKNMLWSVFIQPDSWCDGARYVKKPLRINTKYVNYD